MNKEIQQEIRIRIAANVLFRLAKSIRIRRVQSDIYDLFCEIEDLCFGVKVGSSVFSNSSAYAEYINMLETRTFKEEHERIPIVLLAVNESTEEAQMGFVVGWRFDRININRKLSLRSINRDSWPILFDNIKGLDRVIRVLSQETISVVKRIVINEAHNGRIHNAEIVYLRKFTNMYKMQQKVINDEQERIKRMMFGIPEEEYPSDRIDDDLYRLVKEKYPSAHVKSSLLLFSTELENLKQEIRQYNIQKNIVLRTEPDLIDAFIEPFQDSFSSLQIHFRLYTSMPFNDNFFVEETLLNPIPNGGWGAVYEYYLTRKSTVVTNLEGL